MLFDDACHRLQVCTSTEDIAISLDDDNPYLFSKVSIVHSICDLDYHLRVESIFLSGSVKCDSEGVAITSYFYKMKCMTT